MFADRLVHACLDFILEPLKKAAALGIMMNDPVGNSRYCFTPLAAYIADTPEAMLLAGVCGKTSHMTTAIYTQFGDDFQHEPRTAAYTIAKLRKLNASIHHDDMPGYLKSALVSRLNGVPKLFWVDYPLADPVIFLTPEPLHHWHKAFWDHDAKWCIRLLGNTEIDFRFSVLQPQVGYRHFGAGVSRMKQVTGREHRDMQRYMVGIIDGGPLDFVRAIRSMMDFRYLAQAPIVDSNGCTNITAALKSFHDHKSAVLDAGVRVGESNVPIENWHIPKLELLQSVVPSIRCTGAAIQWSADPTEHAHVTDIKNPAKSSNNKDYESQITRTLDRLDKMRRFELAVAIHSRSLTDFDDNSSDTSSEAECTNEDEANDPEGEDPNDYVDDDHSASTGARPVHNYFRDANDLLQGRKPNAPEPYRTFATASTAFSLRRDPQYTKLTVEQVAAKFNLPDLIPALLEYFHHHESGGGAIRSVGGRRTHLPDMAKLSFERVQVWTRVRLQSSAYHNSRVLLPAQTVVAEAPDQRSWKYGRCDPVVIDNGSGKVWKTSGLDGECSSLIHYMQELNATYLEDTA